MKTINVLRGHDAITITVCQEHTHEFMPGVVFHVLSCDAIASFPLDRPECAQAVADAASWALKAPTVWL